MGDWSRLGYKRVNGTVASAVRRAIPKSIEVNAGLSTKGGDMSTGNALVLREIIDVLFTDLDGQATAFKRLENHFQERLLIDVGNVNTVGVYAEQLRLSITEDERSTVLDYIGEQGMVIITIDVVDAAINTLLGIDRFIEP